jgi:sugar phosphate isomerase/epimerase
LIRNLLMHLAASGLVAARWTDAIHEEWTRNLLADRTDLTPQRLARTRQFMAAAVPDAGVTGFEALIPDLHLPDPDDRHVLAAAITAGAALIVTLNLKDFPPADLRPHGLEAITPDELVCRLLEDSRGEVLAVLEALRVSLQSPPYTWPRLLERLREVGLEQAVTRLAEQGARGDDPHP